VTGAESEEFSEFVTDDLSDNETAILMNLTAKKKTQLLKLKLIPNLVLLKGLKVHNHKNQMMKYANNLKNNTKSHIVNSL